MNTQAVIAAGLATLSTIGLVQVVGGWLLVARMARSVRPAAFGSEPITVLKPLHGNEPLLTEALETLFLQDYPAGYQIIFGVGNASDTAVPVVNALLSKYPECDAALVIDPTSHGSNPKVGNLMNMLPEAKHDILVFADSDVHARPDYLRRLADALAPGSVGLVTTLYTGLPATPRLASRLGSTHITHGFLPGALLGRTLGRTDCLGATMCLSRDTLNRIGGLPTLRDHLADDNVLGQRVRALGLDVVLAETVVATTVPERDLAALWRHELRWARTIRALEPWAFAASVLQYPFFWALFALTVSGGAISIWCLILGVCAIRALAARGIDKALQELPGGLAFRSPIWPLRWIWLLPMRDLLSVAEWAASHAGRRVDWRGLTLEADTPEQLGSPALTGSRFAIERDHLRLDQP